MDTLYRSPKRGWLWAMAFAWLLLACSGGEVQARSLLRPGARGPEVVLVQHYLYQLGHLSSPPDGIFGPETLRAVEQFQRERGFDVDGVVGARTWSELELSISGAEVRVHRVRPGETLWGIARMYGATVDAIAKVNGIEDPSRIFPGRELIVPEPPSGGAPEGVELILWSEAHEVYRNFSVVKVTDVRTGRSFYARRYYGHYHADSEPLTAEDARTLREIYGGEWSWERRPIIVEVGGRAIAASMNGYPHGGESIADNEFPGHFCIHFLGSRIHRTGNIDPRHQAAVLEAAGYRVTRLWLPSW